MTELLLKQKGIDLPAKDSMGFTVLTRAAYEGNVEAAKLLLDRISKLPIPKKKKFLQEYLIK